jgi:dTDP-4-dehydrorhamnose reductase
VGRELQRALAPLAPVVALGRLGRDGLSGDLTDLAGIRRTIAHVQPTVILNAAAYTAVDQAESDPETAQRINGEAPGVMAEAAAELGAWLIHYSTDYVFPGDGTTPWTEQDTPAPLSVYGRTKWAGEQGIAAATPRHLILRTSWVYGLQGKNFPRTLLRLAGTRTSLDVVEDQVGAPTGADLIADVTSHLVARVLGGEGASATAASDLAGIYHLAPSGETTWWALARFLLMRARAQGLSLCLDPDQIRPVSTEAFGAPAPRPANSRLDTSKLRSRFGLHLPPWEAGLERWLQVVTESFHTLPSHPSS